MKRIEFIAPVESMRGNLGSKQSLFYNPNNNRAFDSIEGQLNPALNYEPRLIGARGKRNYFCVKTKSSVNLTPRVKSAMANLGGVGAIYSALVRDKMSNVYINAKGCYDDAVAGGYTGTFRKYMFSFIKPALDAKDATIDISTANHTVSIDNPWVKTGALNIVLSDAIRAKFWTQLVRDAIIFTVNGKVGVGRLVENAGGQKEMGWAAFTVPANNIPNVLNIYFDEESGEDYVMCEGGFVTINGEYQSLGNGDIIIPNGQYVTTNESPF